MPQNLQLALGDLWIKHQRKNNKTSVSFACIHCSDRRIFLSTDKLWNHAQVEHSDKLPQEDDALQAFRKSFEFESTQKRSIKEDSHPRKRFDPSTTPQPPIPPTKRPLSMQQPSRSISSLQALNIGDGISAGSASPAQAHDSRVFSQSPPPRRSKAEQYHIMREPETRPISQEQLVAEVKGIYAGLVMVEEKCIEVDNKQAALSRAEGPQAKLNNEQWRALIALHRTLLHEHHDFFLASQHPSASPALRRLASKYAMPARMWRHSIHSFLELLRHRLPESLDHMLAFIYLAYSMMALLYETVPAFEDTWIECLGDLGRYRMAIEDDDIKDREVWTGVARCWYLKASDSKKTLTTGRLYHHLAILARPNALQQLFYYSKSLCGVPFTSARESIFTLFEPTISCRSSGKNPSFRFAVKEFLSLLDNQIGVTREFMERGHYIANAHTADLLRFASSVIFPSIFQTERFADQRRIGDPNVLPFIHVTFVFIDHMSRSTVADSIPEAMYSWLSFGKTSSFLPPIHVLPKRTDLIFPWLQNDDSHPSQMDFSSGARLLTDEKVDEEKCCERASMAARQKERTLWPSCWIQCTLQYITSTLNKYMKRESWLSSSLLVLIKLDLAHAAAVPDLGSSNSNTSSSASSFNDWPFIPVVALIAVSFLEAGRRFEDAWKFNGIAMASSAIVYLTMVGDSSVSGLVIWTTWIFCASFTALFARQDFLKLRFGQGHMVFVFMTATTIDSLAISALQSTNDASGGGSGNAFFAALLPCIAMSFFACGRGRDAWESWPLQWRRRAFDLEGALSQTGS